MIAPIEEVKIQKGFMPQTCSSYSFSGRKATYIQDFTFMTFRIRLQRYADDITQISFLNLTGQPVQQPADTFLIHLPTGKKFTPIKGKFYISIFSDYNIYIQTQLVLSIKTQLREI